MSLITESTIAESPRCPYCGVINPESRYRPLVAFVIAAAVFVVYMVFLK
jgi:hypothetical protein